MKKSLKRVRQVLGLTQRKMSESIGVTETAYGMMERGQIEMRSVNTMAVECLLWREGLMKSGEKLEIDQGE